jgi:hypothetical protein
MKTWVKGGYVSDKSDVLPRLRDMALQIAESEGMAGTISRVAREIYEYLDEMVTPSHLLGIYILSHHSPSRIAHCSEHLKLRISRAPQN